MRATGVKEKVERAALELFAVHGIDGVAIGDIADRAGVSQGALYRHYASKDELAWTLFSGAYLRTGAELDAIRLRERGFASRITAMVGHFCALYDADPALFRFMLLAQHGFLPRIDSGQRTPVDVIEGAVAEALKSNESAGESAGVEPAAAAALIMGIVLQTATFHIYGRLTGPLSARVPALARAALAAVAALAEP